MLDVIRLGGFLAFVVQGSWQAHRPASVDGGFVATGRVVGRDYGETCTTGLSVQAGVTGSRYPTLCTGAVMHKV